MSGQAELQRRIKRNALLLALLAVGFYVAYYFIQLANSGG